ncbi:hypothetical protein J4477_04205 [Candidatus Pacearchaeota archaeon]|nr:hypothetical protein [Candidatus Pacearchaeota archaeon]
MLNQAHRSQKNDFDINNAFYFKDNKAGVKLSDKDGYENYYFSDYKIESVVSFPDEGKAVLNIKVSENE